MTASSQPESRSTGKRRRRSRSRKAPWYQRWYKNASKTSRAITAFLLVLLGGLSVHAGSLGLAHLQVIRVENDLERWAKLGQAPSPQALQNTQDAIERAIALHADNPYHLSLKARLLEWRAFGAEDAAQSTADYRAALALYRESAALRPLWPDSWAEMINVKLNLGELDEELEDFMQQADKLGPYTPAVHTAIVRASYAKLARYPFRPLPLLETHLLRGLNDRRSRGPIQQLIEQHAQQLPTCRNLARAPEPKPDLAMCRNG